MSALPKYKPKGRCPKCGNRDIGTGYHSDWGCAYGAKTQSGQPHLHRFCRRCTYDWCERPLDVAS